MKKVSALILCLIMLSLAACSSENKVITETTATVATTESADVNAKIDSILEGNGFEGIVSVTHNGEVVYQSASGKDESGNSLTVDSPMYIGSVSKQFCATAIMMLSEQGKLSLDDTLDMYFPEYSTGKDITLKNLLTMRSGVPEMFEVEVSEENTDEENFRLIKEWLFEQPLRFEPDTKYEYVNSNYFLLGDIVEQVSAQDYNDFIRKNIFEPLGMTHSGFTNEVKDSPEVSGRLTYDTFLLGNVEAVISRGAGDIVTNASDMQKWMEGLSGGKLISEDSFQKMTADYSPDYSEHYGYGLMGMYNGGVGHVGNIGSYYALNYINTESGYTLFAVANEKNEYMGMMPMQLMGELTSE